MKDQEEKINNEIGELAKMLDSDFTLIERMKLNGETVIHIIGALLIFFVAIIILIISI